MNISERHVKIQISNIVTNCRKYIFHPKEHENLQEIFDDAAAKLEGIALLFPEGKMSRYLKTYGDELSNLRVLAGLDNQARGSKPATEVGLHEYE